MARVRQPYDEERHVPWLGDRLVEPGEVVAVPDADLASYLEAGWYPADAATKKAGRKLLDTGVISVLVEDAAAAGGDADKATGVEQ